VAKTEFKIKGLKRWRQALDASGFDRESRRNIRTATALNGKIAEALVRKTLQSKTSLTKNAPLTREIKGANKPGVDSGLLFQSITSRVHDDFTVFVGVLRTSGEYNVAVIVHEGAEEKVTPEMRGMFFALWRASMGELDSGKLTGRAAELWARKPGGWLPLKDDTQVIINPGRPFFRIAFANTQMIKKARDNWKQALEATFAKRAKGSDR
jgi:hypothetical protein